MTLSFDAMRLAMIQGQLLPQHIKNPKLLQAFTILPRETFVSPQDRTLCYGDGHIVLSQDRIMLAPAILAMLLERAEIKATDKVLTLGCATGYATIIVSYLADKVIAVESYDPYVQHMKEAFETYEIFNSHSVFRALQDGYPEQAPYDVIFIEGAVEEISPALYAQLNEGGRLVTILSKVGQAFNQGVIIEKREGSLYTHVLFETGVPSLKEFQQIRGFEY